MDCYDLVVNCVDFTVALKKRAFINQGCVPMWEGSTVQPIFALSCIVKCDVRGCAI